jgi:phenylacetate-CoA ligase
LIIESEIEVKKYILKDILNYAYNFSPYYKKVLSNSKLESLSDVPIINQEEFWKANILTNNNPKGIVFKSGGSSGAPKFSYFTHEEWVTFTKYFGQGMGNGILESNDRVANLFYVGDLYASFLFIKDSLQWIDPDQCNITQFPIGGATDFNSILKTFEEFNINVICGVPSQILKLLEYYFENKTQFKKVNIQKILFGGEALYPDQETALKAIVPNVLISSIGCASVDGGLLGYSSQDCKNFEHRVFDEATIIEIVDPDSLEVITEVGRVGKVILTNLTRKLMPIIRYPAGDLAMWVEEAGTPNRKFKLTGRADEAARVGTISVYFEDTRQLVIDTLSEFSGIQFQMLIKHFDHKDELTFMITGHNLASSEELINRVKDAFIKDKKVYLDVLNKNMIHPLKVNITSIDKLESNSRTGKLKRVIDLRF